MQFKHPEILYALFLLIIPIIVHLFQLRRFKKVAFTNVKFLKEVELQTRKSSRLKKLLILFTRLLLFAALIIAFAQPFLSKVKNTVPVNTIIYLDNSYSMQAKGRDGELLKRATQDIIEGTNAMDKISLFTNDNVYENLSGKEVKNTLLSIDYHPVKANLQSVILKIKNRIKDKNTLNNIFLLSDFQNINNFDNIDLDTVNDYFITKLEPAYQNNISIDSVYIVDRNNETITVKTSIKSYGENEENLSVSLFNNNILTGKSSVSLTENSTSDVEFTIQNAEPFNGKITLDDGYLNFDNELYFTINKPEKINVTVVGKKNDFLSKIYTDNEFNYKNTGILSLDYNSINDQHLIVLNELKAIPDVLMGPLKEFVSKGGSLVIIPPLNVETTSYNSSLRVLNIGSLSGTSTDELTVNTINFAHPLLKGVFEKEVKNFQYPTVNVSYTANLRNASSILNFENGKPFISQISVNNGSVYWFSSSIYKENSNFKSSPLIVPIFYNFGLYSYKPSELYYTIGNTNTIEVDTQLKKDEVIHIIGNEEDFIPLQQISAKKVTLTTEFDPIRSGFFQVVNDNSNVQNLAYNYNREESNLSYTDPEKYIGEASNINYTDNVSKAFKTLSENYKITNLWQLFLVLALLFLVTEIILLKFLKS